MEDEGCNKYIRQEDSPNYIDGYLILTVNFPSESARIFSIVSDYYREFMDRLREICENLGYQLLGPFDYAGKMLTNVGWSRMCGNSFLFQINKPKSNLKI